MACWQGLVCQTWSMTMSQSQHRLHVSVRGGLAGAEVPLVVGPHRAEGFPVVLGVDENRVVLGGVGVQHRGQDLIIHLHQLHGLGHGLLGLARQNGHCVPHKAEPLVQDQPVVGGGLGVGLARVGVAVVGYVFIGINGHHPRHLHGQGGVDGADQGVGVGAAQDLDHQAVPGGDVRYKGGLAQEQVHGVLFPGRLADGFQFRHWVRPPLLFWR